MGFTRSVAWLCLLCAHYHVSHAATPGFPRTLKVETNKTEVHLIGIQAYSGGPGRLGYKIEPMLHLALEHIEAHPTILPNHTIVLHFVDSGCNPKKATDAIFEQHVVGPKKFGVYGAGCTGACIAASDVTRNFKTTHIAHLCTGTDLSDSTLYPEFARLSPDLNKNSQASVDFSTLFGWTRVAVVMENQGLFVGMGEALANKIRDDPTKELVAFEKIFPMPTDLEANLDIASVVDRLIEAEIRVILFVGYERTVARLSCEAGKRGYVGSKVALVYATFWINALWYSEFASQTRCTADEILSASQGLIGIDRLRVAEDPSGRHSGSGLLPSEIMQMYYNRCDPALNASGEGCAVMHSTYSYDTAWAYAFTLDRWLRDGHDVSEVDYINNSARKSFFKTEVDDQDFQGLTGRVRHYASGDRDGELQILQVQGSVFKVIAAVIDQGRVFNWTGIPLLWGGDENKSFDPMLLATGVNASDELWPLDRPPVCASPLHRVADTNDVLGSERCEPCSAGARYMWDSTLERGRCLPCDVGTARADGASSPACQACQVGTFANETGMSSCTPCPAGHVCRAGTAVPIACGVGLFAPAAHNETECKQCAQGTFSNQTAMSSCLSCEDEIASSSSPAAARSSLDCRCETGSVLTAEGRCASCDDMTMNCPGGVAEHHLITAKTGYYLAGSSPVTMDAKPVYLERPEPYKCSTDADCPGSMEPNSCPPGHSGLVCASCDRGWTRRFGKCEQCQELSGRLALVIVLGILANIIILIGILRMASDQYTVHLTFSTAVATTIGFFVTFVQIHQILGDMAIAWPAAFQDTVLAFAGVFTFDLQEASLDCFLFKNTLSVYVAKLMLFPVILLQLAFLWFVVRLVRPQGSKIFSSTGEPATWEHLFNAMGQITSVAFVPLAVHIMSIFNCYGHPTGQMSMRAFPSVLCFESEWTGTMLPAGILSCIFFVISPFALFVYLVYKAPTMPNATAMLPFLMTRFRPDAYWWGLVILGRNLALALAMIIAPTKPFVVSFLLMSITLMYLYVVLRTDPWKYHGHNVVDGLTSVAFALVLSAGIGFADAMTYPNGTAAEQDDSSWSVLAAFGTIPFFISLISMLLCAYAGGREARPSSQEQKVEELYVVVGETVGRATPAFLSKDKPDDVKEMLGLIAELSAHDWTDLRGACQIIDALSLDQDLKGRISSVRTSSNAARVSAPSIVDLDGPAQRISRRISTMGHESTADGGTQV